MRCGRQQDTVWCRGRRDEIAGDDGRESCGVTRHFAHGVIHNVSWILGGPTVGFWFYFGEACPKQVVPQRGPPNLLLCKYPPLTDPASLPLHAVVPPGRDYTTEVL